MPQTVAQLTFIFCMNCRVADNALRDPPNGVIKSADGHQCTSRRKQLADCEIAHYAMYVKPILFMGKKTDICSQKTIRKDHFGEDGKGSSQKTQVSTVDA